MVCLPVLHVCLVPKADRSLVPWNWSLKWLWVLGTEPRPFAEQLLLAEPSLQPRKAVAL